MDDLGGTGAGDGLGRLDGGVAGLGRSDTDVDGLDSNIGNGVGAFFVVTACLGCCLKMFLGPWLGFLMSLEEDF